MRALLLILILAATPAWSLTPAERCGAIQSLVGIAIEMRQLGIPAQQAIREYRQKRPSEARMAIWTNVVDIAYRAPTSALYGSGRADYLGRVYRTCMEEDGD